MKKRDETQNSALGTAIIVAVLVVVFGVMLFWMYSVKLLILPDSVAELFGIAKGEEQDITPWDTDELAGAVRSGKSTEKIELTFEINYENLRAALLSESEPEGIKQQFLISYYENGAAKSSKTVVYRFGERFRIEKYDYGSNSLPKMLIIADENTLFYRESGANAARSISRASGISLENEAGIPSFDELLKVIEGFTAAEMDDTAVKVYTDCRLAMLAAENGNVYYVTFTDSALGLREEYYISLEYRVIITHRTYSGDELIYSCETENFSAEPSVYKTDSLYEAK